MAASTLLEVLVSLVIILTVFTISMVIFTNVVTSGFSLNRQRIYSKMENIITESVSTEDYENKEIAMEGTFYQKTVKAYPDAAELMMIHVQAWENGVSVGSITRLVRIR